MKLTIEQILELTGLEEIDQDSIDFFNSCDFTYEKINDIDGELLKN